MKLAIADAETSGLFDFTKPADAPGQPRLANVALILLDESFNVVEEIDLLIKPDGWTLTPEAAKVNGLTLEKLEAEGVPIKVALDRYTAVIKEGYIIVTYNAQFDTKMMRGELRRANMPDLFEETPNICLMRAATSVCQIPGKRGFKFPKLIEACAFFGVVPEPLPHKAIGGARAALEIFKHLHALNKLPEPEVHFAKNRPDSAAKDPIPASEKGGAGRALLAIIAGCLLFAGLIFGGMWGCPNYAVYQQRLEGEAELAKANYSKQVAVQEAQAKRDAASMLAEAEVARAKGVAEANQIIGESLKNNEGYLRYLWIMSLETSNDKVIYVPTEANLPILEASRLKQKP